MIVDFTEIKKKLHQGVNILLREEIKKRTPFLSMIGARYLHEGDNHTYGTVDQRKETLELKTGEST